MNKIITIKLPRFVSLQSLIFVMMISLHAVTASGQGNEPLSWVLSRSEAIAKALDEGKYILLVAGSDT